MANDIDLLAGLPRELDYIRDVALKYGNYAGYAGDEEKIVRNLNASQLKEIRDVYQKMDEQGDAQKLSAWIFQHGSAVHRHWQAWREAEDRGATHTPRPPYTSPATALFGLFEFLEFKGIQPFASGRVKYRPPLNWSKIPKGLEYLSAAAMKWRDYQSLEQLDELAKHITPQQLEELRDLANQLRRGGDEETASKWSATANFSDHPEEEIIYFFLRLLDEFIPSDGGPGLYERHVDDEPDFDD